MATKTTAGAAPELAKIELKRARAELRREDRAARRTEATEDRTARALAVQQRRADRAARRLARRAAVAALGRRLRPVAPLLIVTGFAAYGQISYGFLHYSPAGWPMHYRLLIAIGAAVGIESIALYVQWHAHDALLMDATATAARLRRASYLIALGVAAVNYAHFSDAWAPTPAAVVFALFSASGPWLWGLHTRRVHHLQLIREGQVDSIGATFSAERMRAFPIRTFMARRWSIDNGVTDPRAAWEGYKADAAARAAQRATRRAEKQAERAALDAQPPVILLEDQAAQVFSDTYWADLGEAGDVDRLPDRSGAIRVERDGAVIDDLRALAAARGRRFARDEVKAMYGMGSQRATRLLNLLGWMTRAEQAEGSAR